MFWLPFVTVTWSIFGGYIKRLLGPGNSVIAWLLRGALPLISGAVWFLMTEGPRLAQIDKPLFDLLMFSTFSIPAYVGIYAVRKTRSDE